MINKGNISNIFEELDKALQNAGEKREFTIFGSGALMALDILSRETVDIDMVDPAIDTTLQLLSGDVGKNFGLDFGWLNSAGQIYSKNFPVGWKGRTRTTYKGKCLIVKVLERSDLIATKLNAACQRGVRDIEDLVELTPSPGEIEKAKKWVLTCEEAKTWPEHVENTIDELKKNLKSRGRDIER